MNLDDMTSTELHKWVLNYPVVKEAAAFLDELAGRIDIVVEFEEVAADCRAMAAKLRGETREPPPPPDERLRAAAVLVVETFEPDEAQGYRSKDRQFAVSVLRRALEGKE